MIKFDNKQSFVFYHVEFVLVCDIYSIALGLCMCPLEGLVGCGCDVVADS